jgi:4-hydroxybutyrate dehydrogenase / sulfolactaldehyde 3-reductase
MEGRPQVGFIGLGTMGLPMASNIRHSGAEVRAFDVDRDRMDAIGAAGGHPVDDPAAAARGADFVITMLPNAPDVRKALFDRNGAVSAMNGKSLYIDMSTIHPLETDAIAEELEGRGIRMIDAPVGRTSTEAAQGKLLIMAGGEPGDIERARPILASMGDAIVHCGRRGMGSRMKIINNFMSTSLNVLTAETLALAQAVGMDLEITRQVLMSTAAGRGHLVTTYPVKVLAGDLTPGFMIDLAHKDLGLALDLGARFSVPLPVGAAAREIYSLARAQSFGRKDWTSILELYRGFKRS